MKKAMNKTFLIAALSLSAVAFVGFGTSFAESASAEIQDHAATAFEIYGAYIRVHEDGNNGIKFRTNYLAAEFPKEDFEASGTLIVPADILASAELRKDTATAKNLDTTEAWNIEGDYKTTYAYMYSIPEASYSRPLAVRSYVSYWVGEELVTEYTETKTYALADIAQQALEDVGNNDATVTACLEKFSTVATAGSIVDFSLASNQAIENSRIEFVDEFKGETDVAKLTIEHEPDPNVWNGWIGASDWKVEFYKNYYKSYQKVAFDYYIDGAENMKNFYVRGWESWQFNIPVTIKEGWGSSSKNLWGENSGIFDTYYGDCYNQWAKGVQFYSSCVEGKSYTVYVSAIEAYNPVTVTSSAKRMFANQEFTIADNAATVLANSTNVTLTVFDPNGEKVEVANGKFTPATVGSYRFLYKAVDANGLNVRGEYKWNCVEEYNPAMLRTFTEKDPWTPTATTWEILDSYTAAGETKQGVAKVTLNRTAGTTGQWAVSTDQGWPAQDWYNGYTKEDYAPYETGKLCLRVFVETNSQYGKLWIRFYKNGWTAGGPEISIGGYQYTAGWETSQMANVTGGWVTLKVNYASMYAFFDEMTNFRFYVRDEWKPGQALEEDVYYNVYIDDVWLEKAEAAE